MRFAMAIIAFVFGALLTWGFVYLFNAPESPAVEVGAILMAVGAAALFALLLWRATVDTAVHRGRRVEARAKRRHHTRRR